MSPPTGIIDVLSMGSYNPTTIEKQHNSDLYKVKGAYHCVFNNKFTNQLHNFNGMLYVVISLTDIFYIVY